MRKNIKRLVAVLMVMAMIISMCSTAFAAGHGSKKSSHGSYKSYTNEVTDQVTDPVVEESAEATEDQAVDETAETTPEETYDVTEEETTDMPAQSFSEEAEDIDVDIDTDVTVSVEAEEGAFPADTTMSVKKVDPSAIADAVSDAMDAPVQDIVAVDITFTNAAGEEIQPEKDVKVSLVPSTALGEADSYSVVHITKDADTEELTAEVVEEEKVSEISAEGAVFEAASFSEYVLVSEEAALTGIDGSVAMAKMLAATPAFKAASNDAPGNSKRLYPNGDGTYTLALNVTGSQSSSSSSEVSKANVVLVLDTSSSMNQNAGNTYYLVSGTPGNPADAGNTQPTYYRENNGQYSQVYYRNGRWYTSRTGNTQFTGPFYARTRLWAEIHALVDDGGIIDSLLEQNVAGDPVKSDIMEVSIVNFDTSAYTASNFTTNATSLKSAVNGLTTASGTNWEEALQLAKQKVDAIKADPNQKDEATYVIFLTDGQPSVDAVDGEYRDHNIAGNTTEWDEAYDASIDDARAIVTGGSTFYGLFTWGSSTYEHYIYSLVNAAYTGSTSRDTRPSGDNAKYYTNANSTEALIEALKQITHDIIESVGYTNVEVEDGLTTMTSSSIKVSGGTVSGLKYYRSGGDYGTADPEKGNFGTKWEDAPDATFTNGKVDWDLGDMILENGVTYTVTFVVWPDQDSVDLVADLNNGVISYNDLTEDQKSQISISGTHYQLKTNTDYPTLTYSTVTTTSVDGGEPTQVISDPKTINITNPDPVGLAESKLNAVKAWEDSLDESQREEIEDVVLYLKVGEDYYYKDADGKPIGVTLTEESNWTQTNYISIAPGLMVTEDSPAYDQSATHVTYDGTTYAILETGHEYTFEESDINNHYELTAYIHHPMIMGTDSDGNPIIKDVTFTKDASGNITGIESVAEMGDNLSATNTLKGGINIEKKVVDASDNEVENADPFTVTVNLTDAEGNALPTKKAADGTEYTIDYRIYYGKNNPNYDETTGGGRSDHIYKTGTSFTESIYVGDVIRVVNVENDALFYVDETLPAGYASNSFDYKIAYGTSDAASAAAYDAKDQVTRGDKTWYKVKGNSACYATVTNKLPAAFYVYHSSDNTVERIAMNDSRIAEDGTFNIVDETKSGYIYGGYYKEYALPGMNDADIIAAAYATKSDSTTFTYAAARTGGLWTTDSKGTAYVGDQTSWNKENAYTEAGNAMTPVENTVYYLKEVPDVYLQPATYVVYDTHDKETIDGKDFYQIKKLHLMSVTDDGNYKNTGFDVTTSKTIGKTGTYNAEFWGAQVNVTKDGDDYDTIAAGKLVSNHTGLVADKEVNDYIIANANYRQIPYHITPDSIKVTSVKNMAVFTKNTRFNNWTKPGMYKTTIAKKAAYAEVPTE